MHQDDELWREVKPRVARREDLIDQRNQPALTFRKPGAAFNFRVLPVISLIQFATNRLCKFS